MLSQNLKEPFLCPSIYYAVQRLRVYISTIRSFLFCGQIFYYELDSETL